MISLDYVARQIGGAVKMALGAEDWRASLDRSVEDVFRSATAILISAPLVLLATLTARNAAARMPDASSAVLASAPLAAVVVGDLATFVADWAASLALLVALARATRAEKQAADLVLGFNWIQPVVVAVQLPAIALTAATGSRALGALLAMPALALAVMLLWGVVRRGLGAQPAPAGAIVVMLLLVGVVIDLFAGAAMRALLAGQS